jgi:carbamoyltransferase
MMDSDRTELNILGLNAAYHESSACLVRGGRIVTAAEEERFIRVKHAKSSRVDNPEVLPLAAIAHCLREGGRQRGTPLSLAEIDQIGYSLDPAERLRRNLEHRHPYPVTAGSFGSEEGEEMFHRRSRAVEEDLRRQGFRGEFHFLDHHDCHAASAFFVSPFAEAAVLVIDGIGEWESTTSYLGSGNRLERLASIGFPNSLGLLWEKIAKFLGFSEYDACKVMGLASYASPERQRQAFGRLLAIGDDGGFTVDDGIARLRNEDYSALEELFGLPRRTRPIALAAADNLPYVEVAAALQEATERTVLAVAGALQRRTGARHLCLAGGVALNCVANGKLIESGLYEEIFVQPAAHDAGTAIGAAFLIWNQLLGEPRGEAFSTPYLGPSFSDDEIRAALDARGLAYREHDEVEAATARLIADNHVVGWFQGAMEIGPRALGNRSILADPRRADMVETLNLKVKHREPFRPFCPSVLAHRAGEWFAIERPELPAAYMLTAHAVRAGKRAAIPAVTHVDGTSRMQLVSAESNPRFFRLISEFERLSGVPVLLNTSFNDDEPIVCSPDDAVATFLGTRIDALVAGSLVALKGENAVDERFPDLPLTTYFENLR